MSKEDNQISLPFGGGGAPAEPPAVAWLRRSAARAMA